ILVPSLTLVLVMIAGVVEDAEDYTDRWWLLWVFLLAVVSYLILNGYGLWRRGQTLGKMALGITIVNSGGEADGGDDLTPAPLWKLICVRALFFPLLFVVVVPWYTLLPLVDQLLIFGKRRRCLHDLVAGTVVVRV
ncbi:MAG: RDD family protein, partial [Gammaproteobacteria bacterium]|nr:RDD family protein [Gammaproteobacteria bacterium]